MTERKTAQRGYVPGTSQIPRSLHTFIEQMREMDLAERRAVAARIRELRGHVPQDDPDLLKAAGVKHRAYQKWEERKNPSVPQWPHLKGIAKFHGVDPQWILHGDRRDGVAAGETQLDRLERKLDQLLEALSKTLSPADEAAAPPAPPEGELGQIAQGESPTPKSHDQPEKPEAREAGQ